MKLEQNEKQLLFSETQLPDIFFTDYLPEIPGDYLKIYLYLVFLSKYKKDVKIIKTIIVILSYFIVFIILYKARLKKCRKTKAKKSCGILLH